MNKYLIPANTKKSQLILGFFTVIDLIIFGLGAFITFTLLFIFRNLDFQSAILVLLPVLISGFLVIPVPNYHNVLQLITNIVMFIINRKRYYWKGWSNYDGKE